MPFLLLHGDGLWKVLLVAFIAIVIAVTLLLRKRGARKRAVLATRTLDRDPSEGIVRGTLGGGRIATLAITTATSSEETLRHRDGELWIETPEGRVPLVGEIQVLSGSRASAARNGVPKRTPESLRDNQLVHPPRLRARKITIATLVELVPGDQVVARGALVREAGTEATDYRENATTVSLHATDTPIQVVAQQPRSAMVRPSLIAFALLAGAFGFVGYKIESALGSSWRDKCWNISDLSDDGPTHIVLDNSQSCILASTMPGQEGSLDTLSDRFDRTPITNEVDQEQHLELARVAGGCASSLQRAERASRPEVLLAEAERCHDFHRQQLALIELGRFEEAARFEPLDRGAGALLVLGGNWTGAAALAEWSANHVSTDSDTSAKSHDSSVQQWRCLAELMRWNAGDRAALERVRALSPGPQPACRAELVEMSSGAERDALLLRGADDVALRAAHEPLGLDEATTFRMQQALDGQPALNQESIGSTLADGSAQLSMLWSPMIWATTIAPEPPLKGANFLSVGQGQFAYYEGRLLVHVYDGDLAAAHADADHAIAIASPLPYEAIYSRHELGVVHALIDLYSAVTTTPFTDVPTEKTVENELLGYIVPHIYLRHGKQLLDEHRWLRTDIDALLAAANGDGEKLEAEMFHPYHSWSNMDVLAVLPRIKTHRDEVMQAVKWGLTSESRMPYDFPWSSIEYAAERRTMFEITGDHDEAARWAAIYARYRKAVSDRKTLIALALWARS
jgi:hypothetical protein